MIIVCEQCRTRFHLDDTRMPARGARVRCSRCKHAFHVSPPGRDPEALADALAADAAEAGGAPPPEATRDLGPEPAAAESTLPGGLAPDGGAEEGEGFEEDWQFNEDPPPAAAPPAREPERPAPGLAEPEPESEPSEPELEREIASLARGGLEAAEPEGSPAPPAAGADAEADEDDPLAELGSPETWDLLSDDDDTAPKLGAARAAGPAARAEAERPVREREAGAAAAAEPEPARAGARAADEEAEAEPPAAGSRVPRRARELAPTAAQAGGWAAVIGLVVLALAGLLRPSAGGAGAEPVLRAGGWRSDSARAVRLENARAGTLVLVTGRFERAAGGAPERRPFVQLVDAEGRPLPGARAPLGRALPERRLRLGEPAALRAALARRAPGRDGPSPRAALPLQALFEAVPPRAAGFVLVADGPAGEAGTGPASSEDARTPGASPRPAAPPSLPSSSG